MVLRDYGAFTCAFLEKYTYFKLKILLYYFFVPVDVMLILRINYTGLHIMNLLYQIKLYRELSKD